MRTISVDERRRVVVRRHHLGGDAEGPEMVAAALIALHATDPASVYLSVLARSNRVHLDDVSVAMYERRSLVRWMAMRRTLFIVPTADVPMIQSAVSTPLAATLRRRLVNRLRRNGSEPAIPVDVGLWLADVEADVDESLRALGTATGAQLSATVPTLRTVIRPRAPSDRTENLTSSLLTLMSAEGRIIRASPTGSWTTRHHRWEPIDRWWPQGLPELDPEEAQQALARRWLESFGPATLDDLRWWTGWNKTTVRRAIGHLPIEEVDLHGEPGIATLTPVDDPVDFRDDTATYAPTMALLPALDPTPMGWKHRDWLLGIDRRHIFDSAGNIGPTLMWGGEIIGSWAVANTGEVRTAVIADRGAAATDAAEAAASALHDRLEGAVLTPAIRTPLERSLLSG